jgi:hypothetical protein
MLKQWMTRPLNDVDKNSTTHAIKNIEGEQSVSLEDLHNSLACPHGKLKLNYAKTAKIINKVCIIISIHALLRIN